MSSVARTGRSVARSYGNPLQMKPKVGKPLNPGYNKATRGPLAGIAEPAAANERPFMTWKDKFRSDLGYHTHDPGAPAMVHQPGRGGYSGMNMSLGEMRVAKMLHTSSHTRLHFNGQVPGSTPSNTMAPPGPRALSSKFIPLEMKDDGLLFVHPSSRELLQMTQNKIRDDAAANGRDVDQQLDEAVEEVINHSPAQPYLHKTKQRLYWLNAQREQIMRQETALHKRRIEKGLPVPPQLLKLYKHEYPTDVNDNRPRVTNYMTWYHTCTWNMKPRFGSITAKLSDQQVVRANKRNKLYLQELREAGVQIDDVDQQRMGMTMDLVKHRHWDKNIHPWSVAVERAAGRWGMEALDAEVEEGGAPDDILAED